MPTFSCLFLVGILSSLQLKPISFIASLGLIILFLLVIIFAQNWLRCLAIVGLGCSWALVHASWITHWTLSPTIENKPILIEGYVSSLPIKDQQVTSFDFYVSLIDGRKCQAKVHLAYRLCPSSLSVGQSWRFMVRLRKPHSLMNPGSFDAEKFYFLHRIRATGSVLNSANNRYLGPPGWLMSIQRIRAYLYSKLISHEGDHPLIGVIVALTIGMNQLITPSAWQVFQKTGTNHLVAISGLHIGLVAAMMAKLGAFIWGRVPNGPLVLPTPYLRAMIGVLAALVYSMIAGMSPATERSLAMVFFLSMGTLLQRRITPFRSLMLTLGMILLFDPFAVLAVGFWLSFIAVALLLYGTGGRLFESGMWWRWGRAQWVVTLGMVPSLFFIFQQATLLSIPANVMAIPAISLLVVPTCLVSVILFPFSEKLGALLLHFALWLCQGIWWILEKLSFYADISWHFAFSNVFTVWLTHLASYISLLPKGIFSPIWILVWWLPCLIPLDSTLPPHHLQLVVFDVGQGLATAIRTPTHNLIFDTGAKLNANFDMGKNVLVPYLRIKGIKKIDVLAVSHGDNDHIGGAESLLQAFKVDKIITSVPKRFDFLKVQQSKNYRSVIERCEENKAWVWDGVSFKFLSPYKNSPLRGNNSSCVLKISFGKQSILLTGDIEQKAEKALLARHGQELACTILVAPHHGSKTSSSPRFVEKSLPSYVIFSVGKLNSYGHPHLAVVNRYQQIKARLLNTVNSGAITMTLARDSDKVAVEEFRIKNHRIWQY